MAKIGDVLVSLRAETAQYVAAIRRSTALTNVMRSSVLRLGATLGAGFGLYRAGRFLINTNREFERLSAQLQTVTGSAEGAQGAFKFLEDFAKSTPFQIEENVQAFIRLRALGIVPTQQLMEDFGNTASAFGRRITDFARAVQGAVTGETEALKAFGIVSRIQGEQITFLFNGVTRTVRRSTDEIVAALQEISRENFAGAMAREMNTLNGVISNIQDNLGIFARNIGVLLLPVLRNIATELLDATSKINENRAAILRWTSASIEGVRVVVDAMQLAGSAIVNVFQGAGEAIGSLATIVTTLWSGNLRDLGTVAKIAWEEARTSIITNVEQIRTRLDDLLGSWRRLLDVFQGEAERAGEGMQNTIRDPVMDELNNVKGLTFNEGKAIIRSLIDGMLSGIDSFGDALKAAVKTLVVTKITNVIGTLLGIGSPSKVAREWGRSVIQGFALGLKDGPRLALPQIAGTNIGRLAVAGIGPSGSMSFDFSSFPRANNPLESARDRQWQNFLGESLRAHRTNGRVV